MNYLQILMNAWSEMVVVIIFAPITWEAMSVLAKKDTELHMIGTDVLVSLSLLYGIWAHLVHTLN